MMTIRTDAGIEMHYEIAGTGPPLLLIMGLGGQLTDWHPAFLAHLRESFTVITFDNRDAGLSSHSTAPAPSRWQLVKAGLRPSSANPSYSLADMADDTKALVDSLGYPKVHVVGMSMGGMIAQLLTIRHSAIVASLCSIMSHTGDRRRGRPTPRVIRSLAGRGQPTHDEALDVTLDLFRMVGGPDWDEAEQRRRTTASLARAYNPAGVLRQSLAIAASPDRTAQLRGLTQPSLVVHGLADTLVQPSGGIATAKAIPGSRLLMYPRMGHDLPETRHHEIVQAIVRNAERA